MSSVICPFCSSPETIRMALKPDNAGYFSVIWTPCDLCAKGLPPSKLAASSQGVQGTGGRSPRLDDQAQGVA